MTKRKPSKPLTRHAAFARQACSDFDTYDHLLKGNLPACHHLHYLQMAVEKAAKAHMLELDPTFPYMTHVIAKVVPAVIQFGLAKSGIKPPKYAVDAARSVAARIDALHPQTEGANVEYPWNGPSGQVHVPAEHEFAFNVNDRSIIRVVKEMRIRASELAAG